MYTWVCNINRYNMCNNNTAKRKGKEYSCMRVTFQYTTKIELV